MSDNVESEGHPRLVKRRPMLIKRPALDEWAAETETRLARAAARSSRSRGNLHDDHFDLSAYWVPQSGTSGAPVGSALPPNASPSNRFDYVLGTRCRHSRLWAGALSTVGPER